MINLKKLIFIFLFPFLLMQAANATDSTSPLGFWKTIDDVTGRAKAIVHIKETANNRLYGTVYKIFPGPDTLEICKACEGDKHNKPILGMAILENLKKTRDNPNMWVDGSILDPRSGKVYHCNIQVIENGKKLNVRGYIGLPLFGRSQEWIRVEKPDKA